MSTSLEMPSYDPAREVVEICSRLIQVDTSNFGDDTGPGEREAAELVACLLDEAGIAPRIVESAPKRASVIARWGESAGDPLLIHCHLDVVPAVGGNWSIPPFSGEVVDGCVWGRGAVDMKNFIAMLLSVLRARKRAGRAPRRPLVLCFVADEEAGGRLGAQYLVESGTDELQDCSEGIGEVGGFSMMVGGRRAYLIESAEKGMTWMKLTAYGQAGHASMLNSANPVTGLAEAIARIGAHQWPLRLTATMQDLFGGVRAMLDDESAAWGPEQLLAAFGDAQRMLGAAIRNVASPTVIHGGFKTNVVPSEAVALIDGRPLPGYEEEFVSTLSALLPDGIEMETLVNLPPLEQPFRGGLVRAIRQSLEDEDPGCAVLPYLLSAGTDAKHFSRLGIRCFGFTPMRLPADLDFTALFHGVDERVPIESLEFGTRVLDRFLDLA